MCVYVYVCLGMLLWVMRLLGFMFVHVCVYVTWHIHHCEVALMHMTHIYTCYDAREQQEAHVCMYVCILYVRIGEDVLHCIGCVHVNMYMCVYICQHMYMYIYIYIYIHQCDEGYVLVYPRRAHVYTKVNIMQPVQEPSTQILETYIHTQVNLIQLPIEEDNTYTYIHTHTHTYTHRSTSSSCQ
jgi:hypothetical protein